MRHFKIVILIFILFISTHIYAAKVNDKEWIVFVKSYRDEQFCVNFPRDPDILDLSINKGDDEGKIFFAKVDNDNVNYSIEVIPNNDNDYFEELLTSLKNQTNIEIVDHSFSSDKKNNKIIDISYKDNEHLTLSKTRTIITKSNIYTLFTSSMIGGNEDHKYFITSFFVEGQGSQK